VTGATTQLNIVGTGFLAAIGDGVNASSMIGKAVTIYGAAMGATQINGTYKIAATPTPTDTTFSVDKASAGTAAYVKYADLSNIQLRTTASCNVGDSLKDAHTLVERGAIVGYNLPT
jgi:hypothetical protein